MKIFHVTYNYMKIGMSRHSIKIEFLCYVGIFMFIVFMGEITTIERRINCTYDYVCPIQCVVKSQVSPNLYELSNCSNLVNQSVYLQTYFSHPIVGNSEVVYITKDNGCLCPETGRTSSYQDSILAYARKNLDVMYRLLLITAIITSGVLTCGALVFLYLRFTTSPYDVQ